MPEQKNELDSAKTLDSLLDKDSEGATALDGFFSRLSIPDEWEEAHNTIEQIISEEREQGEEGQ